MNKPSPIRTLLSFLGLCAFAALVWFAGPLVAIGGATPLDGEAARIALIGVAVLAWLAVLVWRLLSARHAERRLAAGLGGAAPAGNAVPVDATMQRALDESDLLAERFREALAVLRRSGGRAGASPGGNPHGTWAGRWRARLSGRATSPLGALPWYVLIGPPGAGKTTALKNSGLRFPLAGADGGGEAMRGVGGTRLCDWWFTDEAVLIDTAGRYTTQDSDAGVDASAWMAFLALLRRYRRRRPINGILVAIGLDDLLDAGRREQHAAAIRRRIAELDRSLGLRFPVYVMLTKADRVAGFADYFDALRREERDQVWGVTFGADEADPVAAFTPRFDALVERLNRRLLERLAQEPDAARRARLFGFPAELAMLKGELDGFLAGVFGPSRYDDAGWLRGVYLTSATQSGSPIDRVIASVSQRFGLGALPPAAAAPAGSGRSHFLGDLLRRVVFAEAEIVGVNRRLERRRRIAHGLACGGLALGVAGVVVAWAGAQARGRQEIERVSESVRAYDAIASATTMTAVAAPMSLAVATPGTPGTLAAPATPGTLAAPGTPGTLAEPGTANTTAAADAASWSTLLARLDAARALAPDAAPSGPLATLRPVRALDDAARRAYLRELHRLLAPRLGAALAQTLRDARRDTDPTYAALKGYLMFAQPERRDPAYLKALLQRRWEAALPAEAAARLQTHLDALLAGGLAPIPVDAALVRDARAALNRVPLAELAYSRLKRDALAHDTQPFVPLDALGPAGAAAFERRSGLPLDRGIPGFFTARGQAEVFAPQSLRLTQSLRADAWVLGDVRTDERGGARGDERAAFAPAELATLGNDVARLYAADCIQAWRELLGDLRIAAFRNDAQALDVLAGLSGRQSALRTLLVAIDRQTRLAHPDPADAGAARANDGLQQAKNELSKLLDRGAPGRAAAGGPAAATAGTGIAGSVPAGSAAATAAASAAGIDRGAAASPVAQVDAAFADLGALVRPDKDGRAPVDALIERLAALYAELGALQGQDLADPVRRPDLPSARALTQAALAQPQPVRDWLLQLADGGVQFSGQRQQAALQKKHGDDARKLREQLTAAWQSEVLPFCSSAVANRYPADRRSPIDATPKDFARVFAPGGLIDGFVRDHLRPFIDAGSHPWRWRTADDIDLGASPDALRQLEAAAALRDAWFRDGGALPGVDFALRVLPADGAAPQRVALTQGEQPWVDRAMPAAFKPVRWPAGEVGAPLVLSVADAAAGAGTTPAAIPTASTAASTGASTESRSADGPWAWLRLLDQATIERSAADRLVATFRLPTRSVRLELRASSVLNPFLSRPAEAFQCPKGF